MVMLRPTKGASGEVALPLEMDAITLHDSVLWDGEEQPIKLVETLGHAREPPFSDPRGFGAQPELAVSALVVYRDELMNRVVKFRESEFRIRMSRFRG